jgi:hypothetical protein
MAVPCGDEDYALRISSRAKRYASYKKYLYQDISEAAYGAKVSIGRFRF